MKQILIILCFCLVSPVCSSGTELTLEACLQRAEQHNSEIKAFEMANLAANELVTIRRTLFYPTLKLQADYSMSDSPDRLIISRDSFANGVPTQDVTLSTGKHSSYHLGLYLRQPLYTGGNLTHHYHRAELETEASKNIVNYQRSLLTQTVTRTYSNALAALQKTKALQKMVTSTNELARVARERLMEGHARREEVIHSELNVSRAEAALARGESEVEQAFATLRKLIDAPLDETLNLAGTLTKAHLSVPLSQLLNLGIGNRSDLKSSQAKVGQADADIAIARSAFFPNVSLVGSYQRQQETAIARPEIWTIGAQVEWDLFEWGRTSAMVRRATALARQESYLQEEARKTITLEIEQLWRTFHTAESQLRISEAEVKSLEYSLDQIVNRFQQGFLKRSDLLIGEAALWNSHATYVQSAADLQTALATLERAVGSSLAPWVQQSPLYEPVFNAISALEPHQLSLDPAQETVPAAILQEKQ